MIYLFVFLWTIITTSRGLSSLAASTSKWTLSRGIQLAAAADDDDDDDGDDVVVDEEKAAMLTDGWRRTCQTCVPSEPRASTPSSLSHPSFLFSFFFSQPHFFLSLLFFNHSVTRYLQYSYIFSFFLLIGSSQKIGIGLVLN